jgi:hypothetical protein
LAVAEVCRKHGISNATYYQWKSKYAGMSANELKRVFDIDVERCPNCGGGELKIIAAILERPVIEKILAHLGLDPQPPPRGRVRKTGQDFAT